MKHKLLLLIFAFLSVILAKAQTTFNVDGINYYVTDATNLKVEVSTHDPYSFYQDAIIPATVLDTNSGNTYAVTAIGNNAFFNCNGLTSVTIPNSVTRIGDNAFSNCEGLPSVTIPNSVTSIGNGAFSNCSLFTSVEIPSTVSIINPDTFLYCSALTTVTLPNTITSIGGAAFKGCSALNSIAIPDTVTTIGGYAFEGCTALTSINLPNSVTSIGRAAFSGSGLTAVTIPNSITSIESSTFASCSGLATVTIPATVTSILDFAFADCPVLTSIDLPNSVTSIGLSAFFGSGLTAVTIPASVTSIGEYAFGDCTALTSVTVLNPTPVTIIANVFNNITLSAVTLNVPTGSSTAYKAAAVWQDFLYPTPPSFTIGDFIYTATSATTVSVKAANTTLTTAPIPNSITVGFLSFTVTSIEDNAFLNCTSLTSVTIPGSITTIGNNAFDGCTALTSVTVATTTPLAINANVFANVTLLNVLLNVPSGSSTTYIAAAVWQDFLYPGASFTIGDLIYTVTSGTTVSVKAANTALTTATIPSTASNAGKTFSVTAIEDYAFRDCYNLASITITTSITSVGVFAFYSCTKLTSVMIPNSVTTIGSSSFKFCIELSSITLPNSLTSIQNSTFADCYSLKNITIPASVTSIEDFAFSICTTLTSVTVSTTTPLAINANVFANVTLANVLLNVSSGSRAAYKAAAVWQNFKYPLLPSFTIGDLTYTPTTGTTASVIAANRTLTTAPIASSVTSEGETFTVTAIESSAFYNCTALASVTIPDSITTIGDYAFNNCIGLTSVTVLNATPLAINANVFQNVNIANVLLNFPSGSRAAYKAAAVWQNFKYPLLPPFTIGDLTYTPTPETTASVKAANRTLTAATIPSSVSSEGETFTVTAIEVGAFVNCFGLSSVTIPNSVTSLGDNAFAGCESLINITIPSSVTSIGEYAFSNCNLMTNFTMPASVTSIGRYAFYLCSSLTNISIPTSVTFIGNNAFQYCTGLTSVTVLNPTPLAINASVFSNVTLANVLLKVPASSGNSYRNAAVWQNFRLLYVGNNLAYEINYSNNTVSVRASEINVGPDITIPNTVVIGGISYPVKKIENSGFEGCKNLVNIKLPISTIGTDSFKNSSIVNISYNNSAINYSYSRTSNSNTSDLFIIESGAFSGCTNLESFEFPESTASIGEFAFQGCTGLTSVTALPATPVSINANVFDGVTIANIPLKVAAGSESLYANAAVWQNFNSVTTLKTDHFSIANDVKVYPNPSTGIFTISLEKDASVEIYDLLGKVIYTNKVNAGESEIDISNYQSGLYLLQVATENGSVTKKIIKE